MQHAAAYGEEPIAEGRLKALDLAERDPFQFRVHVMHMRGREIGRAGPLADRGFARAAENVPLNAHRFYRAPLSRP